MSHIVEFKTKTGEVIPFMVGDFDDIGMEYAAADDHVQKAKESVEELLAPVTSMAESLISSLGDLSARPSEIAVEFGVAITGKTGGFLATVVNIGAEASIKVTLKWSDLCEHSDDMN